MKKENLILVHSYPTNSIILAGLINYLNYYFAVYPVDLPGFIRKEPPLKEISLKNYCDFLDRRVEELNLETYLIAGISFGFRIINDSKLTKSCKGIIAIEPYLNSDSLKITKTLRNIGASVAKSICRFGIEGKLWNEKLFKTPLFKSRSTQVGKIIHDTIDPRTFFKTIEIIASDKEKIDFHNLPHALVINQKDKRIKADKIIRKFNEKVKKLYISYTNTPHFPKDLSANYFRLNFKSNEILNIINFFHEEQ